MKRSRFSEEQIAYALRLAESGRVPVRVLHKGPAASAAIHDRL